MTEHPQSRREAVVDVLIPISIFANSSLSPFETIVKHLKENMSIRLSDIARLTGRDPRAVGVTYRRARRKQPEALQIPEARHYFPIGLLSTRKTSVFESITLHLKETCGLRLRDIAQVMGRDESTVWTIYQRASEKKLAQLQ